jgi:hypothetical protein
MKSQHTHIAGARGHISPHELLWILQLKLGRVTKFIEWYSLGRDLEV